MREGRWEQVTPSQFAHERAALEYVRLLLPDNDPYRAWANFTFTAGTGHIYEVDLLVAAPSGLYLIEVKSWVGTVTGSGSDWVQTNRSGRKVHGNALHLADRKAKQLKTLLQIERGKQRVKDKIPFVKAAVFFSVPGLRVDLPEHQLNGVYGPEPKEDGQRGPLPGVWSGLLGRTPRHEGERISHELSAALPRLLKGVGIAPSKRRYRVGAWELEQRPFDAGPTWQDHLAKHSQFPKEQRRIRKYLSERNASEAERASIERAARRELVALHGISHPGIVQVDTLEPTEDGPALVFRHEREAKRLDHYMAEWGGRLDALTRVGMIRQLAEAVGYAHSRRLYHRALSARSVYVLPGRPNGRDARDDPWLRPQLQISDWQAAARGPGSSGAGTTTTTRSGGTTPQITPTRHVVEHVDRAAEAYLAPELTTPDPDSIGLDVFGLGTLSYLLLAGQAPAGGRTELQTRLAQENGLRPSSVSDSVSEMMDELVQAATAPVPAQRLGSVGEFVEMLESVEEELTSAPEPTVEAEPDPLEARPGDLIGGQWRVKQRLGTGSTSRAFLTEHEPTGQRHVLKIGLSDEKAKRLEHEARALRPLKDARVIRLAQPDPIEVGGRTVLVLENAFGRPEDRTLARALRDDGRLTVDELETYSDHLFIAADYLEGEGVTHRDIKPDNIAVRTRPNRTRQLVLFDFSLAGVSVQDTQAGTPRYLDPFIGTVQRPVYDAHAERYALAVTLHEMASGELPVWGDGATDPRHTDGPPTLAAEAFDVAIRDGLVAFFHRALHRDATQRWESLKAMRDGWREVFRQSDEALPARSVEPEGESERAGAEPEPDVKTTTTERDRFAAAATRETPLEAAGLSPRAISAAQAVDVTTVGELLKLGPHKVTVQAGVGHKTRKELLARIKQWREQLEERDASPLASTERRAAKQEIDEAEGDQARQPNGQVQAALARVGLDAAVTLLVPPIASVSKSAAKGRNRSAVEATRLLLGLPDEAGALPDLPLWPKHHQIAEAVEVTTGRVAQILEQQRRRWRREPVLCSVHAEVVELLQGAGRVMGVPELAAALLARRGSTRTGEELRRAVSTAVVRAAVEMDPVTAGSDPRLLTRRHGDRVLVALEAGEDDSPETPAALALLDYADALGKAADKLAGLEVLPAPATVLRELSAVSTSLVGTTLDDRRLVQLAAAASSNAAATARLEIYPRDLDHVRALRLAQAGVAPPADVAEQARRAGHPGRLTPAQVRERVRARFPDLDPQVPDHPTLDRLLRDAGFDVTWERDGYVAPARGRSWSGSVISARYPTSRVLNRYTAPSPELGEAAESEQRLTAASDEGGFRVLTVRVNRYARARDELTGRFNTHPVNVTALFLSALHELVDAKPRPTWETVLAADVAEPNSRDALKLREYVEEAWKLVRPRLTAPGGDGNGSGGPLLLYDAGPLARYDAMDLLYALREQANAGGQPVWVLCPMDDPEQRPRLDSTPVNVPFVEWVKLPDAWVTNQHRSGDRAS